MSKIAGFKKGKELGHGMLGTVYETKFKDKKAALKIERVKKPPKEKLLLPHYRGVEFMKTMAKYPFVLDLYHEEITTECDHRQKYVMNLELCNSKDKKFYEETAKSKYCAIRVTSQVDTTVTKYGPKITKPQVYSLLAQFINAVAILHKHGYLHGDLHGDNMGIKFIKEKTIIMESIKKRIPSHGVRLVLIDYGLLLHKKYPMYSWEKERFNDALYKDITRFTDLVSINTVWEYAVRHKIKLDYSKNVKKFAKTLTFKLLDVYTKSVHLKFLLCRFLYPNVYTKICLESHDPGNLKPNIFIDLPDIITLLLHHESPRSMMQLTYRHLVGT